MSLIMQHVHTGMPVSGVTLINYTKQGAAFCHTVDIQPLDNGMLRTTSHVLPNALQATGEGAECLDLLYTMESDDEDAGYHALDDAPAMFDIAVQRRACRATDSKGSLAPLGDPLCILTPAAQQHMAVVTDAHPPFAVRWASDLWMQLCGFELSDVVGSTLKLIQGPATDQHAIARLSERLPGPPERAALPEVSLAQALWSTREPMSMLMTAVSPPSPLQCLPRTARWALKTSPSSTTTKTVARSITL